MPMQAKTHFNTVITLRINTFGAVVDIISLIFYIAIEL